jgi:hypothetical protein
MTKMKYQKAGLMIAALCAFASGAHARRPAR